MASSPKKSLSNDEIGILFFIAAIVFGTWFRMFVPYSAGFPINDGGLFYNMIAALQENDYRLPEYVSYNGLDIPYTYPPFAFYATGILSDLFGISLFDILLWFPAAVLIATIPVIYHVGYVFLRSRGHAGLSALIYALLPGSLTWLIMGGGITRSLGQFFLLLAISRIYLVFTEQKRKHIILAIIFSSLVCLTHPEAAIHTIAIALFLWVLFGRNRKGSLAAFFIATGTLILTSIWWIPTLLRFGIDPYLSAAGTGLHGLNYLIALFVPFSGEPFLTIIALLTVFGAAVKIAKREFLVPGWYILPFIVEPRSAANVAFVPMVFLASIAIIELIFPTLSRIESELRKVTFSSMLQTVAEKVLIFYLLGCLLIGMQYYSLTIIENRLSPAERKDFEWVKLNTPADGKFLILTGKTDLFADFANEWFPVLADRRSVTTIQGYEWSGDDYFSQNVPTFQSIQRCINMLPSVSCIENTARAGNIVFDYVIVTRSTGNASARNGVTLELEINEDYELIYKSDTMAIFEGIDGR